MKLIHRIVIVATTLMCMQSRLHAVQSFHELPENEEPEIVTHKPIAFSGYIRHDMAVDTRQFYTLNEGEFNLLPLDKNRDLYGRDSNKRGQLNMLDIQSRVRAHISTPDIGCARTYAFIELDFQGRLDLNNVARLRHGYFVFAWDNWQILMGQTDNPMYVKEYEPRAVALDNGAPFHSFGRNPLVQCTYDNDHWMLQATMVTQVERQSDGPVGPSTTYMRNAMMPNVDVQAAWHTEDHNVCFRAGANIKRLRPRLSTFNDLDQLFKVDETIMSYAGFALAATTWTCARTVTKVTYSQNLFEYEMLSGYAVRSIDAESGKQRYTNSQAIGWFIDNDITHFDTVTPGILVGYTQNIGFVDNVDRTLLVNNTVSPELVFARAPNMHDMIGIMPRCVWRINQFTVAGELQYNRARYGTINADGHITPTTTVNLYRFYVALFYNF